MNIKETSSTKTDRTGTNNGRYDHGMCKSKLYNIWRGMKERCLSLKRSDSKYYRLKGISVCDNWMVFKNFMEWSMLNGYQYGFSLDRKDGDKGYCPSNCRYIPLKHQARNLGIKENNSSGYIGVSFVKSSKKFRAAINISRKSKWIGQYNTAYEAAIARDNFILSNNLEHYKLNIK